MNFTATAQDRAETVMAGVNPQPFVTVSAASYKVEDMAPGSIVAGFGTNLATTTLAGSDTDPQTPGIQLPKQLGGTTVRVGGLATELFYVSPGQINYVIPPTLAAGT